MLSLKTYQAAVRAKMLGLKTYQAAVRAKMLGLKTYLSLRQEDQLFGNK